MVRSFIIVILFFSTLSTNSQVVYGVNGYIEFRAGELPVVISVPHGGDLEPNDIPDRTCNNAVYASDLYTIELARQIDTALFKLTGCHPYIVINHLHRKKLDCNRAEFSATCNDPQALVAWNEFHDFIDQAQNEVVSLYGTGFYLDLHGHGNIEQRIELGYMLYDDELELSDATLNTSTYVNYSSLYELVLNNVSGSSHSQLLRGTNSLGSLLSDGGYASVPSSEMPSPGLGNNYFSGGYNTATHTSANPSNFFSGVQVECNYHGIRDSYDNRHAFSQVFSNAVALFMETHYQSGLGSCSSLSFEGDEEIILKNVYPNPFNQSISNELVVDMNEGYYVLSDLAGRVLKEGDFVHSRIHIENMSSGVYDLKLRNLMKSYQTTLMIVNFD